VNRDRTDYADEMNLESRPRKNKIWVDLFGWPIADGLHT